MKRFETDCTLDNIQSFIENLPYGDEWTISVKGDESNKIEKSMYQAKVIAKYKNHIVLEEVKKKGYKRKADVLAIDMFLGRGSKKVVN